jgi:PTS system nitrogen regulatory IIA component
MLVKEIISPELIAYKANASSKKRALEKLSELLSNNNPNLSQQDIFESFLSREKLGSTALGHGVALPHGRLKSTDKTSGAFLQLDQGVDFDAEDQQPVDLIFAMLVPEESTEEHLKLLSQLAEMFSSEEFREKLRAAENNDKLYKLFENWVAQSTK